MPSRKLPLAPARPALEPPGAPPPAASGEDRLGRPLRELRVSVTDRCNFRCGYCMPKEVFGAEHRFLPKPEILSFEEIARIAGVFASLGVRKIRLTGGEPLLRAQLSRLVQMLGRLPGVDLAMTTNGALLGRSAAALASAGLGRVTVSLDALDPEIFRRSSDSAVPVGDVLTGIDAALDAGLRPLKVNCVVRRDMNDSEILPLARRFRGTGVVVRFIEFMDVGTTNGWRPDDVVTAREIVDRISRELPLEPVGQQVEGEVARRYRYRDGGGEIGVIASVTRPFCGTCTRARLSADGHLYTCLFASSGVDLRPLIRRPETQDDEIRDTLRGVWAARTDRYSELRADSRGGPRIEMSYIGG